MMKTRLGIDLGDQWIKIVELRQKGRHWDIKSAAKVETPPLAIVDGEIMNQHQLYSVLKSQLELLGIKTKKVCVRISSKQVLTKYMPLQVHSLKEAKRLVRDKKNLYFPVEGDYVIDATITGEKRGQELGALMVAAPNRVIQPVMGLVDQLGLKVAAISIASYGYCKQFEEETALVIDIGASMSSVSCVEQGACKIVNHVGFGMKQMNAALDEEFGRGEMAEVSRFYEKHMVVYPEETVEARDFMSNYVSAVVTEGLENQLLPEVQKMISFYEDLDSRNRIDTVYVTGDCGKIKGIIEYFEVHLGMKVSFLVPGIVFEDKSLRRVRQDLPAFANILCLTAASA